MLELHPIDFCFSSCLEQGKELEVHFWRYLRLQTRLLLVLVVNFYSLSQRHKMSSRLSIGPNTKFEIDGSASLIQI